ncbi:MAG: hypothetical protein MAG795_00147 [Candidatus Woesearchaeota archaeon]|nr:hypothetical protein [Candidatus Woesearchaeota archaeon]
MQTSLCLTDRVDKYLEGDVWRKPAREVLNDMHKEYETENTVVISRGEVQNRLRDKGFDSLGKSDGIEYWLNQEGDYFAIKDTEYLSSQDSLYFMGQKFESEHESNNGTNQLLEDCIKRHRTEFTIDGFGMILVNYVGAVLDEFNPKTGKAGTILARVAQKIGAYKFLTEKSLGFVGDKTGIGNYTEDHNQFYKDSFFTGFEALARLEHMQTKEKN